MLLDSTRNRNSYVHFFGEIAPLIGAEIYYYYYELLWMNKFLVRKIRKPTEDLFCAIRKPEWDL